MNIITNEWMDASRIMPPIRRNILIRWEDGRLGIARWSGYYWLDQDGDRLSGDHVVTHWYMFEKWHN